jgi:hypothetical protein
MPLDPVALSSQSDGRWKIAYVPSASNALSIAILNGVTSKPLTYSFTPDGFNLTKTQAMVNDPRLTLIQVLSRPGKVTETLELKYVASADAGSADAILTNGLEGQFTVRRGIDNATNWVIGQKAQVIKFQLGVKRYDPPVENGVDTVSQTASIIDVTNDAGVLVA